MTSAELRIPRHPAFVGLARLVVAQAARLAGVPQDRVQDIKIAVDEALATATSTDDLGDRAAPLDLRFGLTSRGFEVVVQGLEEPTNPSAPPEHPGIDLLDPKLSLTLIEGLTDEFSYEPDGNLMRLRFVVGVA